MHALPNVVSGAVLGLLAVASACSSPNTGGGGGFPAAGGSFNSGGSFGTGGVGGTGGFAAMTAGGVPGEGGFVTASGGAPPFGSGGTVVAAGGVSAGGAGNTSTGGDTNTGGNPSSGGAAGATGGVTSTGGTGAGGNANTGGRPSESGLPPGVAYLFPPPNGSSICPDPPLRISFSGPPTLGNSGRIQVYGQSGNLVASVDMSAGNVSDVIGGTTFNLVRRAFVDGNDAVVYLKNKALSYGQTYYVTVDSGAIVPPGGGSLAITGSSAWRFTTASSAPANTSALAVALDGSGNFCSVQGAADAAASGTVITMSPGLYHEVVHMSGKSNVTFRGQDRQQTVILGTNNNKLNPSTSTRSLVGFDQTNGLTVQNLTIHNLTPQDGTQAEALRIQNCDKCVVRDADILSLQDTLLWSGRVYAKNCYIAGNVDYVWGTGVAYFDQCEIHTVGRSGVLVQARNAPGAYGYVFVDSKLTADAAATNNMLARIDVSAYPGSHVAYINCQMTNIASLGWTVTGGSPSSALRFWEYQSEDASGNPLNTSGRLSGLTPITSSEATMMRDPTAVLNGWQPPN